MAIASGLPVPAQTQVIAPKGYVWEVTTKTEIPDGPISSQTNVVCLAKDARDENYIPSRDGCRITKTERDASLLAFSMICEGKN
jgi:hypothetical protein